MIQQSRNASPHSRVPRHPTNRVRLPHVLLLVTPLGCLVHLHDAAARCVRLSLCEVIHMDFQLGLGTFCALSFLVSPEKN